MLQLFSPFVALAINVMGGHDLQNVPWVPARKDEGDTILAVQFIGGGVPRHSLIVSIMR